MSKQLALAAGAAAGGALFGWLLQRRRRRPRLIATKAASPPAGHYSQAVAHAGVVYVSGLLPVTPSGARLVDAPFAEQARQVLASLRAVLAAAGSDVSRLTSVRVYVDDVGNWPEFNALYAEALGGHRPARAVVPVPGLHYGLKLELEATAACD